MQGKSLFLCSFIVAILFSLPSNKLLFINQDALHCQSISGKLNSNELPLQGQSSDEYANKKGKIVECDVQESGYNEKMGWKKNASSTEAMTSVSTAEKETVTTKIRLQAVKVRQTYSGPIMPTAVLTHSVSERARVSERFVINN